MRDGGCESAIINAIYDATGMVVTGLPISTGTGLKGIRNKNGLLLDIVVMVGCAKLFNPANHSVE